MKVEKYLEAVKDCPFTDEVCRYSYFAALRRLMMYDDDCTKEDVLKMHKAIEEGDRK